MSASNQIGGDLRLGLAVRVMKHKIRTGSALIAAIKDTNQWMYDRGVALTVQQQNSLLAEARRFYRAATAAMEAQA